MEYDSEDCKDPHKLKKDDLVIVIMGPTATGKSNIIDNLTGQLGKRVGHSLKACTTVVGAVRIKNHRKYGDRIVLVDTPGFDDTEKSDLEILRIISDWLMELCKARVFLCGIAYLHRITDMRMSGSHQRNLSMLGELCGTCAAKKVTLVTTMWDGIEPNDLGLSEKKEEALKSTYWKSLLDHGASTARFQNTTASAWAVIGDILAKPVENIALQLQEELVSLGRPLEETEAAKRLEFRGSMENNLRTQEPKPIPKKKLQESPEWLFSEMQALKLPVGRRLLKTFASAFHITRRQAKEFQENDKGNAGKETGVLFANDGKKDSERKRSVIDKERMNLPGREIEGVVCEEDNILVLVGAIETHSQTRVNEINGPPAEQQSDAFKKEFFVRQETGGHYSAQISELESHTNIGNMKCDDIMALSGDDIIIAYVFFLWTLPLVINSMYRIMGLTGTGKSNVGPFDFPDSFA
ncbi:hypothetical protein GALMADRAFT_221979 [Galerina marginata CBS 339.88]|uniref:AIG1-type G domain-containing protein n=1 Tax=Galerina marginata (strain CBS 339.88) TaxID=685588 RepID=A0A067TSZ3_GALM3|nr:hypothetical protein GALMADRAFT_221979 [Galerina marginata CBS 339.88]